MAIKKGGKGARHFINVRRRNWLGKEMDYGDRIKVIGHFDWAITQNTFLSLLFWVF